MRVEFLARFSKDLDDIKTKPVKKAIEQVILKVEKATQYSDIPQIKKPVGHKSAYRIRIGDYRIGIFMEGDLVQFARVVHRRDIYKVFP